MSYALKNGEVRSSDLYFQRKSHGDLVFRDSFFEKLYMWSDDCDGKIWDKEHSKSCILSLTSWYPGFYSGTAYVATLVHTRDDIYHQNAIIPYVSNGYSINGGYDTVLTRTKDYVLCCLIQATWGAQYNSYRVSKDGVHWREWQSGFAAPWASTGGWSTKKNSGITYGTNSKGQSGVFRLDIDDSGTITETLLTRDYVDGSFIGDILTQGLAEDGSHRWYKFININGEKYTSILPGRYQYHDAREGDPASQVKWADYSWTFRYLNGKYYAFTSKEGDIYWNSVTQEWDRLRSIVILESVDGFKSFSKYTLDPCPRIYFQSWDLWYFNEQIIIMEFGKEHENDQEQYFKLRNINFSVMGTIDGNIKMPFRGFNKDPSYDELVFYFVNQQADGYRQCSRGFDFSLTSAIYINDEGKVCEPYGSIIFRTAFCKNAWSSGSYDCGGFIFIQYRDDDFFGMTIPQFAMAYTTQNSMIDRDNATWGSDYFHNIMHAIKSFQEITIRERKGFDRNTYTIKDKGNGVDAHLYFDFLNDGGLSAYDNLEYDISYSLSNWVVGYYDKTRDDFYYDPEYTNPIPKNVNYSYLVFIGRYQQTPTTWIWVYDLYYWDVVGFLLQKGDAYAFTHQEEELPSGIHHSITLKRTLRRELTYTDFRSRRLLKDSEYYHEDNGYFTKIGDTEFEGGYSGYWTYAFAARVSSTNIAPLILSDEEEPASYINRTYYKTKLIKYFDKWWYYTDLSRSVSVNTNQAYGRFVNELITNIHMVPIHCLIKVYGSEYRQYKEDSEYFVENAGLYTTAKQGNYERKCYKENPGKSYCIGAIYKNGSYNFLYTIILSDLHSPAVIKLDNPEWTSSSWGIVKHNNRYWYYTIANVMSWLYNAAFTERSMNIQAVINNRYHTDDDIALYCLDKIYKNEDSNEVLEL